MKRIDNLGWKRMSQSMCDAVEGIGNVHFKKVSTKIEAFFCGRQY